jgi:hypothetical protein
MNIQFVDEPESDLVKRRSLYLDPDSELSSILCKIQDDIELEGFTIDRSRYKYIQGRLCKFNIDLISEPDLNALTRRANSMKKLTLNLSKLKWEFNNRVFALKIGKIQDKELFITVAFIAEALGDIEHDRIREIKDNIINGKSNSRGGNNNVTFSSPLISSSSSNVEFNEEEETDEEVVFIRKPSVPQSSVPIRTKPVNQQVKMMSQPFNSNPPISLMGSNNNNNMSSMNNNMSNMSLMGNNNNNKNTSNNQQQIVNNKQKSNITPIQQPQIQQAKPTVSVTKHMHMFKIRG